MLGRETTKPYMESSPCIPEFHHTEKLRQKGQGRVWGMGYWVNSLAKPEFNPWSPQWKEASDLHMFPHTQVCVQFCCFGFLF